MMLIFYVIASSMTTIGRTRRPAGVVIRHHGHLPIIADARLVPSHVAIPRPGVPAHLDPALAAVGHALLALGASHVPGRPPQSLREVGVVGPLPRLLALEPPPADVLDGVQLAPLPGPGVLREVLALRLPRLVIDPVDRAVPEELVRPLLGRPSQAQVVLERDVGAAELPVVLVPPPVVAVEVLDLAGGHLAVAGVVSHHDVVLDRLARVPVGPVHHELVVHVQLVPAVPLLAAYAVADAVGQREAVLAVGDAHGHLVRGAVAVGVEPLPIDHLVLVDVS
mmetsp:Transcript_20150/g.43193  ORF Transcript_20150/g.43193 Transcript_20150/m.43193 type:complete len:280 (+) Transcript_20150:190-1029(+)